MESYRKMRNKDWRIAGTEQVFGYNNEFLALTPANCYQPMSWVHTINMCEFIGNDGHSIQISCQNQRVIVTFFKNGVKFVPEDSNEIIKDILKMSKQDNESDCDRG